MSSGNLSEIEKLLQAGMILVIAHDNDQFTVTIADDAHHGIAMSPVLEEAMEAAIADFYASGMIATNLFGDIEPGDS